MKNLEKQGRPRIGVEANKNHSSGIARLKLATIALIASVLPGVIACSNDFKKCAGQQGKNDKAMLTKLEKICKQRVKRMERRDDGDSEDVLFRDAYDSCKILNNKSFEVEARLRAALDTAERKDYADKVSSCRKAIADTRERGEKGAKLADKAQSLQ
jgi:hypothetical protein